MQHELESRNESSLAVANQSESMPDNYATAVLTPPPFQLKESPEAEAESQESNFEQSISNAGDDAGEDGSNTPNGNGSTTSPDHSILSEMGKAFGQNFSDVNLVQNSQDAQSIGARAFAQGSNIHFAPGQYNPDSLSGRQLIGHELTHVVQQRQGRVAPTRQLKGFSLNDDSSLEKEADIMGAKAARGESLNLQPYHPRSSSSVIQGDLLSLITGESQEEYNERRSRSLAETRERTGREYAERQQHPEQWLVAFSTAGEENIIREYNRSHELVTDSTYVENRNFYRVGDVILTSSFTPDWLHRIFPDINNLIGEEQETTYWDVLGTYLDSDYGQRKMGWKISSINTNNAETGQGSVNLQAVLFVTDNEAVSIPGRNGTQTHSRESLDLRFNQNAAFAFLTTAIGVIGTVTDFCVGLLSGSLGLSAIRRSLGAAGLRLLPSVLRGPILRIVRFLGSSLVSSTLSVANKVIRDVEQQEENNQIRERAGTETQELHYEDIITEALVTELTSVISGRFTEFLNNRISEGLAEVLPSFLQQSLGTRLKTFIAQQIAGGMGRTLHLGAAFTAARRRANRGENFNQALGTELRNKLAPVLGDPSGTANVILGSFVSTLTSSE